MHRRYCMRQLTKGNFNLYFKDMPANRRPLETSTEHAGPGPRARQLLQPTANNAPAPKIVHNGTRSCLGREPLRRKNSESSAGAKPWLHVMNSETR